MKDPQKIWKSLPATRTFSVTGPTSRAGTTCIFGTWRPRLPEEAQELWDLNGDKKGPSI